MNYRLTDRKPLGYTDSIETEIIHEDIPVHGENPPMVCGPAVVCQSPDGERSFYVLYKLRI